MLHYKERRGRVGEVPLQHRVHYSSYNKSIIKKKGLQRCLPLHIICVKQINPKNFTVNRVFYLSVSSFPLVHLKLNSSIIYKPDITVWPVHKPVGSPPCFHMSYDRFMSGQKLCGTSTQHMFTLASRVMVFSPSACL